MLMIRYCVKAGFINQACQNFRIWNRNIRHLLLSSFVHLVWGRGPVELLLDQLELGVDVNLDGTRLFSREMGWLKLGTCVGLPPIFLTKLVKVWQTRVVTAMLAWEKVSNTDQGSSKITWIVRCSSKVATVEGSIGKWPIWGNCKWYRVTLWKAPSLVCPWN